MSADGLTQEQTGLIQVFRSVNNDRRITLSAEHTVPPTLTLTKNHLSTQEGIAISSDGIAYNNGTTISNTTWVTLQDRVSETSAVAPNGGNGALLVINKEIAIQNADTSPTRVIDTMAGDPTVVGEHFGIEWVGNTKPFTMATLDSTPLQINDTTLNLLSADASTNLLPSGIFHTGTTTGDDFTISTNQDLTITADNIDLSSTGRLIIPTLSSRDYFDYNTGKLTLVNSNAGGALNPQVILTNTNATGSVAMEIYKNKPTIGITGEPLFTQSVFGKDNTFPNGNKQEYTRITHTIRDPTNGSEEGSIEMGCFIGGTYANMLQLNGVDAPSGEVNILRPLDLTTGSTGLIKVSGSVSTDMTLDATLSAGTGNININPKVSTGVINFNGVAKTDSAIETLTGSGGSKIDFAGGSADDRFDIDNDAINLHWNNTTDQADISLLNDVVGANSAIDLFYQSPSGNIQTILQNIPSIHRFQQLDSINARQAELSPAKLQLTNTAKGTTMTLDNNFALYENKLTLSGADTTTPTYTLAEIVNRPSNQLIQLSSNGGTSNSKTLTLMNETATSSSLTFNNQIDANPFNITSNQDLNISSTKVGGTTQVSSPNGVEIKGDSSVVLNATTNTGGSITLSVDNGSGELILNGTNLEANISGPQTSQYLQIRLNGNLYKIALYTP